MSEILTAVLAKVGMVVVEAIVARLVWELCAAYKTRTQPRGAVTATA